jgi:hypothetical protein
MASEGIAFDKSELRGVMTAFKAMEEEGVKEAKDKSGALAEYAQKNISQSASSLQSSKVASRIADGSRISKSSKVGELSYGFVAQKFSGGGTTRDLWGGSEFGSNKFKQFPVWSGSEGRGSKGWFIYPTLRRIQPYIVSEWTKAFDQIIKKWT